MSIKDRGTKKWTSFFIPEQIKMINQMYKEDEYKKRPLLDEQELEEINLTIHHALHQGVPVEITYFQDHDYQTVKGTLLSIDLYRRKVRFQDEKKTEISLDDILCVSTE